ncbi:EsaB/YukD family protein [Cellulosilyticum lentocellum]|uniref:Ubiquitin-like domain-containing protein n=1 Tax=Cellulosilyticum lentocellum (strain ATCC 49066 / DSM 5427 / NCIMB 11756 / RHM5) TaxID=642492 RepID=F2JHU8_CELLD|nr:EsaB/YukD family protein [Cellulosilyticum lentocellum]ADZ85440.1 protein of unknown function ubiquitin-like YukD [Cellulosilyticum lentocellum DSM 5427]
MDYIFITLNISKDTSYELKIPGEITAGELIEMISEAFHLKTTAKRVLQAEPLGRILGEDEVLIKEGVFNGSQITLL